MKEEKTSLSPNEDQYDKHSRRGGRERRRGAQKEPGRSEDGSDPG